MLFLLTVILCIVSYLMNINTFILYISYVVGFAILKGILSDELKDVFNIKKAKGIYNKVGFLNSVISFNSLLLITVYYIFNEYDHVSFADIVPIILCYILMYRFIFWDMAYKVNNLFIKSSH